MGHEGLLSSSLLAGYIHYAMIKGPDGTNTLRVWLYWAHWINGNARLPFTRSCLRPSQKAETIRSENPIAQ